MNKKIFPKINLCPIQLDDLKHFFTFFTEGFNSLC